MSIRNGKRMSIGILLIQGSAIDWHHHPDKPTTFSERRFFNLWIGYGFGSWIIDFK